MSGFGGEAEILCSTRALPVLDPQQTWGLLLPLSLAQTLSTRTLELAGRCKPDLVTHRNGRDRRNPRCAAVAARLAAAMAVLPKNPVPNEVPLSEWGRPVAFGTAPTVGKIFATY